MPQNLSCPIGVVCAVCTCILPPSDVIYSVDDGFTVLHTRVCPFSSPSTSLFFSSSLFLPLSSHCILSDQLHWTGLARFHL